MTHLFSVPASGNSKTMAGEQHAIKLKVTIKYVASYRVAYLMTRNYITELINSLTFSKQQKHICESLSFTIYNT